LANDEPPTAPAFVSQPILSVDDGLHRLGEEGSVTTPALIGVDWGSSSFRAYLMARDGAVVDAIATADGVASVAPGGFPATFQRLLGDWLDAHPAVPVLASGMVGSRNGWREAPYVPCPADLSAIAENLIAVEANGRRVPIAPGLSSTDENGEPDVLRGEEVEILGIAEAGARLVVLPGSHSKWAVVEAGRVLRFKTFVTGELFAAIRDHTLIGAFARAAPPQSLGAAFARGARRGAGAARGEGGGLLGALFGARSLPLMRAVAEADAGDYLSGLLIGAEIAEARRLFPDEVAHVAGAKALVERYRAAFAALGEEASVAPAQAAARGLLLVALQAGLV
jgi:2-dehydro-3-deoxygalactonokinase